MKLAALFCLSLVPLFAEPYTVIEDKAKLPILTPSFSEWKKMKIRLDNNLEALLISDPSADQSGALLSVHVGSWSDPEDQPGLAHFLEHMLFLGTKKYPEESEYVRFINNNGGEYQAFTTASSTNYIFTIDNSAFLQGLDRFASFFKEPLFNPSGVNRELNAIDQEYAKNIQNDTIRQYYIEKELSSPKHPHHKFNMGNKLSLTNASQDILKKWYADHYSANLMRLIVYSNLPMNQLLDEVVKDFSGVQNSNKPLLMITEQAMPAEMQGKFVYIKPIKDQRKLTLVWELPAKFIAMRDSQPESLLCHVLGHEGEKSLLAELKKENLADALGCGALKTSNDLLEVYITIDLTESGLKELDLVITRVYQTLAELKEKGIPRTLYDEYNTLAKINYQYQSKVSEYEFLEDQARKIHDEPLDSYPERTLIIQKYDPEAIHSLISFLTPQNARYFIQASPNQSQVTPDKKEKWIGAEYAVKSIPEDWMKRWSVALPNPDIAVPDPNYFVPRDLRLVKGDIKATKGIPTPTPIIQNDHAIIYYAKDTRYQIPKISWNFTFRTPAIIMSDPEKIVMGDFYVKFLKDALNKYSYPAQIAGLNYTIERGKNGITLEVEGYSQNAFLLLKEIMNSIVTLKPTTEKFLIFKESLIREYQNFVYSSPFEQSAEYFKSVVYQFYTTEKDKSIAIRNIDYENFISWFVHLYDQSFIEGMLYGNLTSEEAAKTAKEVALSFKSSPYPKKELFEDKILVLDEKNSPVYLNAQTESKGNAVFLAIENPNFSLKQRAAQQIIAQAIKEPFFDTLRTKQQTGYIVYSTEQELERKLFNFFVVQSNTHNPRDLLARFESFIEDFVREIGKGELTEPQFESIKQAQILNLQQNPKNVKEMGKLLTQLAFKYDADFDWVNKRIASFKELTYDELVDITQKDLGKGNKRRLAILLEGDLPKENQFVYKKARSWSALRRDNLYEARNPI